MGKNKLEVIMKWVFFACAMISIIALLSICYFIFANALPFMTKYGIWDFLSGSTWKPRKEIFGIAPMLVGSLYVTLIAMVIAIPAGVFTAVFMAYYCPPTLHRFLKPAVNLMAGIPSIIYGYFGLVILVPFIRRLTRFFGISSPGLSVLAAGLVLAIMVLPTIITTSESSLRAVPRFYYEASIGLGATHDRTSYVIMVPAAKSGIIASIILGLGRAVGETMAVIMVAGNQPIFPRGLFQGTRTMTTNIMLEMAYASGTHRDALIATGAVLFVIVLIINAILAYVNRGRKTA
ncbi:MAG: phosphate ABC transporter permease subunit PstC [Aerococcus sp.]|nr:phosphate ABC transporter permease subunit PstC [Aerococcus sp.]